MEVVRNPLRRIRSVWSSGSPICARSTRSASSIRHLHVLPPTQPRLDQCRCRQGINYVVADRTFVYAKCDGNTIVRDCPVRMRIENWSDLDF